MYPTFFVETLPPNIDEIQLDAAEAHHAAKVLRLHPGDPLRLVDGRGAEAWGRMQEVSSRRATVEVEARSFRPPPPPALGLAVAPVKSSDRLDFLVEKATELGVDELVFLPTERTEKARWREDRVRAKAISALKQSKRRYLPVVRPFPSLESWLEELQAQEAQMLFAHCEALPKAALHEAFTPAVRHWLVIGPEGDFSPAEIQRLRLHGRAIELGALTLRTETAALAGLAQLSLLRRAKFIHGGAS
jgi:16S rRNA (uracil1498-N3)-methyltransferase